MGRYTSIQTFSDQDAQGAAVPYQAAVPSIDSSNVAGSTTDGSNDTKLHISRVENVSGSVAGAGSGEFHTYRAARRRFGSDKELERVAAMEQRYKENKAQQEFEAMRKRKAEEFQAKMHKRAEKRRRRKERAKAKALDEDEDKTKSKEKTIPEATNEAPMLETPGGVAEIPNDGSFLEKMLALQQEKEKEKEKEEEKKNFKQKQKQKLANENEK